ncbi:uncharacterized protein METZ01_LOCUS348353 [marine metagenome]|uniref:Uncharacterized protein n=1 Tax=marine metagenome TaxID=408172 RepID=A0A382RCU4_9ZZZZ
MEQTNPGYHPGLHDPKPTLPTWHQIPSVDVPVGKTTPDIAHR